MASEEEKAGPGQKEGEKAEHFAKKALKKRRDEAKNSTAKDKPAGVAHVPSTVMTVEYIDDSEGMDASLRALENRMAKLEELIASLQENYKGMVVVINQQAKEIQSFFQSLSRRVDGVYKRLISGISVAEAPAAAPAQRPQPQGEVAEVPADELIPEQFRGDPYHKKAFMIARVMADDLEEYYPDKVREGALYGNFQELLAKEIEDARNTYLQRVPESVKNQVDYFARAIDSLVARKQKQLREEAEEVQQSPQEPADKGNEK